MCRIMGWIDQTTAHHVMTTWLKHQSFSDPVIFTDKMKSFVTHGRPMKFRLRIFDYPDRITTGMAINTLEYSSHQKVKVQTVAG